MKIAAALKSNGQRIDHSVGLVSLKSLRNNNIFHINATSTMLPIRNNNCVDRVIAFEFAQHFKPLIQFIQESNRILERYGLVVLAMPVITNAYNLLSLPLFIKLNTVCNLGIRTL